MDQKKRKSVRRGRKDRCQKVRRYTSKLYTKVMQLELICRLHNSDIWCAQDYFLEANNQDTKH